jgi:hypothetical protein
LDLLRHFLVSVLVIVLSAPVTSAQSLAADEAPSGTATLSRLQIDWQSLAGLQQPPTVSAALHPAAKGALIGAAVGAGAWGGIGLWYCTIGPNEVGECGVEQWVPGFLVWGGIGAGIGALIGALR